jgi:hypothetical protein
MSQENIIVPCEHCDKTLDLSIQDHCPHCGNSCFAEPLPKNAKTLSDILDLSEEKNIIPKILDRIDLINRIKDKADPDAIVWDGFDNAIVGISHDGRIVYDLDYMRTILVNRDGMSLLDADEYLSYNVLNVMTSNSLFPIHIIIDFDLLNNTL